MLLLVKEAPDDLVKEWNHYPILPSEELHT